MAADAEKPVVRSGRYWLVYVAVFLAGCLLLAEAFGFAPLQKITARLGVALVYSAIALLVAGGRPAGYIGTVVVCLAVIVTFLV